MSAQPIPQDVLLSYREYCLREAESEERHDFDHGRVVAMAGGSLNHSRIGANIASELRQRLKGKTCETLGSDYRIAFPGKAYSHYPDAMVVCGPPQVDPGDPTGHSLTNPTAVVEVQSPSTADFDRGGKFDRYRTLDSVREYVIVFQDRPEVHTSFKQDDDTWLLRTFTGLDAAVPLSSLDVTLPMAEVYDRVTFEAGADAAGS